MVKKIILVAIFTIGCFMAGFMFAEVAMGATQEEMEDYAERTAMLFDLSPELVKAVIQQESDWNVRDVSSAKCKGLMQLADGTGKWCADKMGISYDPFDWQCNIACGCYYLDYLRSAYRQNNDICEEDLVYYVLIAYNRGIAGANKWIANHDMYSNGYANGVLSKKEVLERA